MQTLISKYGLAAHLALVAVAPLFLSAGAVIWLSVLGAVWLVMEPSRIGNEMLHDARRRVTRSLAFDPLFWVLLALLVVSIIRMFNVGIAAAYDAETSRWSISDAALPLMPGSVEGSAFPLVGCAAAALVSVSGCRHCLGRSARGAFALVASMLSAVGAYVWALLCQEGSEVALSAVECPLTDPSFAGGAYGIFLVCAVVSLVVAFESSWRKVMPLTILGISGNLLGLFLFSPPAIAAAYAAVTVIIFIYAFVYLRLRLARTAEFKFLVFFGMGVALAVVLAEWLLSRSFVDSRTMPYLTGAFVPDGYLESRAVISEIVARAWKTQPWLGFGYGSFPIVFQFNAMPSDWEVVSSLQKAVPNGYLMLLVERGVVGAFFLAVPLVLLLVTYVRRLVLGVMRSMPNPLSWVGFLILIVAALETLFDASFLAPGTAVALVSVFALSAAAFPKEMRSHG